MLKDLLLDLCDFISFFADIWTLPTGDDFTFYDHVGVNTDLHFSNLQNSYYPAILDHLCEIEYTPAQYSDIQNLSTSLNHLASTQKINPLNEDAERLRLTLQQVLNLHNANPTTRIYYNYFTTCRSANNLDPRAVTTIYDFARLSTPEFQLLVWDLSGLLLQYMNSNGLGLRLGFMLMNRAIERFFTDTSVILFSDHPLLNVESVDSTLVALLKQVVEGAVNFFF